MLPDRKVLLGIAFGAIAGVATASMPGTVVEAIADEFRAPAFDPSQIVKFEDRDYRVESEPWVSADPTSTVRVKKIEAGKVTYVTISTTATGTYSTDALFSRHVQYPGITATDVTPPVNEFEFYDRGRWHALHAQIQNSFATLPAWR